MLSCVDIEGMLLCKVFSFADVECILYYVRLYHLLMMGVYDNVRCLSFVHV